MMEPMQSRFAFGRTFGFGMKRRWFSILSWPLLPRVGMPKDIVPPIRYPTFGSSAVGAWALTGMCGIVYEYM